MSGIGGLVRLDGAPVRADAVDGLSRAAAHRGGDAQGQWAGANVAFVHAMLHMTAESVDEPQPRIDGDLVLAADVRLDNRAELIAQLAPRETGDAALIGAAYRRWGAACVDHLEGDFAFALWDRRERVLFCARDPFGVKPLVYAHLPGKLFAFGSVVRVPLALAEVPRDVDETRIAQYLSAEFVDVERTFHRDVRRLPGGCTLTLRDDAVRIARYWSPDRVRPLPRMSDDDYAAGFLEHFTRAVHDRMRVRTGSELGSMLSGGLDSSFISCVARTASPEPLPVVSWIFSDAMEADEREYQHAVLATGGFRAITLDSGTLDASPWSHVDSLLPDGPVYAPNHYLNSIATRAARDSGVRVLLDGLGGDSTVSRGAARHRELFFYGRALALARELRALAKRRGERKSLPRLFFAQVVLPLLPRRYVHPLMRLHGSGASDAVDVLHPRMRPLVGRRRHRVIVSTREEHLAQFGAAQVAEGLELFDRICAAAGVEGRYPFFDRRLAEYCLSLPGDQKLSHGYDRIVARRAMEGIVPAAVQWRRGKGAPGLHLFKVLREHHLTLEAELFRDSSALEPYVDFDALRRAHRELLSGRPTTMRAAMVLWNAALLGEWLRRN